MEDMEFEKRVLQNEPRLYRVARTMLRCDQDCADALQEGILRAWQRLESLRDKSRFDAWLMRIVVNECRNIQRGYKRRPLSLDALPEKGEPPPDIGLRHALDTLSEKYRLPLVLHHAERLSIEEIARLLRLPQSTVKWRLHEARRLVKMALGEEAD